MDGEKLPLQPLPSGNLKFFLANQKNMKKLHMEACGESDHSKVVYNLINNIAEIMSGSFNRWGHV